MGSLLFLASWTVLLGPVTYAKHLTSAPRLPFTAVYFGSIALTLYFAIGVRSTFTFTISSLPSHSAWDPQIHSAAPHAVLTGSGFVI